MKFVITITDILLTAILATLLYALINGWGT